MPFETVVVIFLAIMWRANLPVSISVVWISNPLTWVPLYRQPPHVFFPHRRHAVVAELECSACHGEIGDSKSPPLRVTRLGMQDCIECHERSNARTDCTTCHR